MDHVRAVLEVPSSPVPSIFHTVTQCSVLSMPLLLNYAHRKKTECCLRHTVHLVKKQPLQHVELFCIFQTYVWFWLTRCYSALFLFRLEHWRSCLSHFLWRLLFKNALVSVAVLVISLGVLQCSFHDALFTFVNLLFHSSLSFSLSLSPSMESALLLPLFPFFSSRVCSFSSFCSSFHCGSIIFPLSRLVSFLHHASLSLFFANVLPIPPVSPSQLPAVPPHISPLPPSRAKCFISRSSSMSVSQSLGFVCYTKTISPGTFLQSVLASLGWRFQGHIWSCLTQAHESVLILPITSLHIKTLDYPSVLVHEQHL